MSRFQLLFTIISVSLLVGCVEEPNLPVVEVDAETETEEAQAALHPPSTYRAIFEPWQIACTRASEQGSWVHPSGDEIVLLYSLQHMRNGEVISTQFGASGVHDIDNGDRLALHDLANNQVITMEFQEGDQLRVSVTLIDADDDSDAREAYDIINDVAGVVGDGVSAAFPPAAPVIQIIGLALDLFGYSWDFFDWLDDNDVLGERAHTYTPRPGGGLSTEVISSGGGDDYHYFVRYLLSIADLPWSRTNHGAAQLAAWASHPGTRVLSGNFDRNGYTDLVLLGGRGWSSVPVAFGYGDGSFRYTNRYNPTLANWASRSDVTLLTADFNGDGLDDVLAAGGSGWTSVPVAHSDGGGGFNISNRYNAQLARMLSGATVVAGNFDGNSCADLVIVGAYGTHLAQSDCRGGFSYRSVYLPYFQQWARHPGAELVVVNVDGDAYDDLAFIGGQGWNSVPVALTRAVGVFQLLNRGLVNVPQWATQAGVKVAVGHFDDDSCEDLALVGGSGWNTMPVALSNCDGSFTVRNDAVASDLASWAQAPGVRAVAGDFDDDGYGDVALVGGSGWGSIPVVFRD
jgi:hypothetical protein